MLITRSEIARGKDYLNDEQRARLELADQKLLHKAQPFYNAISSIADLAVWCRNHNISPEEWWWYLDVIVRLPIELKPVRKVHHADSMSPVCEI
jgi:hypothetical protein